MPHEFEKPLTPAQIKKLSPKDQMRYKTLFKKYDKQWDKYFKAKDKYNKATAFHNPKTYKQSVVDKAVALEHKEESKAYNLGDKLKLLYKDIAK